MFFDLNVPVPSVFQAATASSSKKGKGKQQNVNAPPAVTFSTAQIGVIETRIDLLVRLGYSVFALNQFVAKKVDPKSHVNTADCLVNQLKKRTGILYLKRLSIILDDDSEKGFGLTTANASLFTSYDLIGLVPLTQATFSLACLTHTMPSPLTAHIISLPLSLPRLSFYLKHTLVRTAIKNGAVFEISYVGAIGGENDTILSNAGGAEDGPTAKRNWWAAAKEVVRVTKGKNVLVSGGVISDADLRAPNDVANLITILGLPQDAAHAALTKTPKSLALRAQTRQTYRAVFSEPKLVIPEGATSVQTEGPVLAVSAQSTTATAESSATPTPTTSTSVPQQDPPISQSSAVAPPSNAANTASQPPTKKRPHEGEPAAGGGTSGDAGGNQAEGRESKKKKRKKNKGNSNS